jgi:hypothetical protein
VCGRSSSIFRRRAREIPTASNMTIKDLTLTELLLLEQYLRRESRDVPFFETSKQATKRYERQRGQKATVDKLNKEITKRIKDLV